MRRPGTGSIRETDFSDTHANRLEGGQGPLETANIGAKFMFRRICALLLVGRGLPASAEDRQPARTDQTDHLQDRVGGVLNRLWAIRVQNGHGTTA
jgi:hypothetical protein